MNNIASELEKLAILLDKGVLTQEEFESAKKLVLNQETAGQSGNSESTSLYKKQPEEGQADLDYLRRFIRLAKEGYGFQSKQVMQEICQKEIERIKEEKQLWRLGGAIIGGLVGLGDGFDLTDIFFGAAVSQIGASAHGVASAEQIKFLEQVKADWLITANSPHEIASRLGPPSSRIIMLGTESEDHLILNYHRGNRGEYLIPLRLAKEVAHGFLHESTREVLISNFTNEDYETLSTQLYPVPDRSLRLKSFRKVSSETAEQHYDRDVIQMMTSNNCEIYLMEADDVSVPLLGFKVPVPVHSDF